MSITYNAQLKKDIWRGNCGSPELREKSEEDLTQKVDKLVQWIKESKHTVIHTGAGISTAAGIPDFRGPNGVWTREQEGALPPNGVKFEEAKPTISHMALVALFQHNLAHYIVTQNVDGLHLRSGVSQDKLSELHGNCFREQCAKCGKKYERSFEIGSIGFKPTGRTCDEPCRGVLKDCLLDWYDELPEQDLARAEENSKKADLHICIGTSLQMRPAGNLPLLSLRKNRKPQPGKLVIINLQKTPKDFRASLLIRAPCDEVFKLAMERLGIALPAAPQLPTPIFSQTLAKAKPIAINKKRKRDELYEEKEEKEEEQVHPHGVVVVNVKHEEEEEEEEKEACGGHGGALYKMKREADINEDDEGDEEDEELFAATPSDDKDEDYSEERCSAATHRRKKRRVQKEKKKKKKKKSELVS